MHHLKTKWIKLLLVVFSRKVNPTKESENVSTVPNEFLVAQFVSLFIYYYYVNLIYFWSLIWVNEG